MQHSPPSLLHHHHDSRRPIGVPDQAGQSPVQRTSGTVARTNLGGTCICGRRAGKER